MRRKTGRGEEEKGRKKKRNEEGKHPARIALQYGGNIVLISSVIIDFNLKVLCVKRGENNPKSVWACTRRWPVGLQQELTLVAAASYAQHQAS